MIDIFSKHLPTEAVVLYFVYPRAKKCGLLRTRNMKTVILSLEQGNGCHVHIGKTDTSCYHAAYNTQAFFYFWKQLHGFFNDEYIITHATTISAGSVINNID